MKRLIPMIAAVVALAGPLALGGAAVAKDHNGGGGSDRGGERGGDRGGDRGNSQRRGDQGGYDRRYIEDRGRGQSRDPYTNRGGPPQGYRDGRGEPSRSERSRAYQYDAPQPYYAPPSARRGGYMPPQSAAPVPDYGRYRLRPPPRGYTWVRTANGYAMVGEDGRVFDVVPY